MKESFTLSESYQNPSEMIYSTRSGTRQCVGYNNIQETSPRNALCNLISLPSSTEKHWKRTLPHMHQMLCVTHSNPLGNDHKYSKAHSHIKSVCTSYCTYVCTYILYICTYIYTVHMYVHTYCTYVCTYIHTYCTYTHTVHTYTHTVHTYIRIVYTVCT